MAEISGLTRVQPSILDRLIDKEPQSTHEVPGQGVSARELRASLLRDLENLLNTRWRCVSWPPDLDQLETSVVNYGVPDFSGIDLADAEAREHFRQLLERIIRRFEPRFKSVTVKLLTGDEDFDRVLAFRINALMYADPVPEAMILDTRLEPSTGFFDVETARS